jgi:para-aminobenzoate synthetase component 1
MIEPISKSTALQRMNQWGKEGTPFLFLIDFEIEQPVVLKLKDIPAEFLQYQIGGYHNNHFRNHYGLEEATSLKLQKKPLSFEDYRQAFDVVRSQIQAGNSYLTNLTFPTQIEIPCELEDIFRLSEARYKIWWKDKFTVFSPEIFVTINEHGQIASFPMKGTIDAHLLHAEEQLLSNTKEKAEHATIVDLIRNDLSTVASEVRVEKYRYVETINTWKGALLQTSSKIVGQLSDDYIHRLGEIIFRLLPAGSISGAPKKKTVEIIQSVEKQKRGYYTGVCGIFDGKKLDCGVMIRYIESTDSGLFFRSGGGITAQSNINEEYLELLQKVYLPYLQPSELLLY